MRKLISEIGLAEGWLVFNSAAKKSNLQIGLAIGQLTCQNKLRELMRRFGLAGLKGVERLHIERVRKVKLLAMGWLTL